MAKGTFTIYEGKSKKSGQPFTALMLEFGKFHKMIFLESELELDYLKAGVEKYDPKRTRTTEQSTNDSDSSIDLNSNDTPDGGWFDN